MMIEYIRENLQTIVMCGFIFLCGIGIGAVLNEIVNEEDNDVKRN